MDISKLTVSLKHRNPWSAIDLGFLLARKHYGQLIISWMLLSLPLFLLTQLFGSEVAFWGILFIWWLKPFWDRGPLYIISKALFAEQVSYRDLLKQYRFLLSKNALAWLTYKRFNTSRSFVQPVIILEGLTGSTLSKRLGSLLYGSGSTPTWLTIVCMHFEMILITGIYALIIMLIPDEADIDYWEMLTEESAFYGYLSNAVIYLCTALMAPFYVCAGFMLYINRRILLEGWDIEIQFRLLASQLRSRSNITAGSTAAAVIAPLCLVILSTVLATASSPGYAEDDNALSTQSTTTTVRINNAEDAKHLINEVFDGEDFVNKKQVKLYRLRNSSEKEEEQKGLSWWQRWFIEWWQKPLIDAIKDMQSEKKGESFLTFSQLIEVIIWLLVVSAVIYIATITVSWYRQYKPTPIEHSKRVSQKPDALFGFDMRNPRTEKNIGASAATLWQQQDYRAALALLYGALLSRLIHHYDFDFREGYTEQECALIVEASMQKKHQPLKPFVKQLTQCWLQVAYAHQIPNADLGDELCQQWSELFDEH